MNKNEEPSMPNEGTMAQKKDEDTSMWRIEIQLRNSNHEVLQTIHHEGEYDYSDIVRDKLDQYFIPELNKLKWCGFGLWSYHVAIEKTTIFAELNFLRESKGEIVLQCEDHNCQWRAMKISGAKYDECVVCLDDKPCNKFPACGHASMCGKCYDACTQCPICRYPFLRKS